MWFLQCRSYHYQILECKIRRPQQKAGKSGYFLALICSYRPKKYVIFPLWTHHICRWDGIVVDSAHYGPPTLNGISYNVICAMFYFVEASLSLLNPSINATLLDEDVMTCIHPKQGEVLWDTIQVVFFFYQCLKEYVSLIIGLYKNNGSLLHVGNFFLFIHRLYTARTLLLKIWFAELTKYLHHGIWQHVTFTLLPRLMSFYHGQILTETETDS